jgi:hypothetical protein
MGFALQYLGQDEEFWRRVVFSDEKVFQSPNDHLKVYRPRNSTYEEPYVQNIVIQLTCGHGFLRQVQE